MSLLSPTRLLHSGQVATKYVGFKQPRSFRYEMQKHRLRNLVFSHSLWSVRNDNYLIPLWKGYEQWL